ncbi:3-hydroxyisobutyrate dehydrogenase-like beta-hydroxyacid dehydrogenase [Homoserinimonas aerilata]|uniref:3-hydroxyisobutyrate dehydrogenase-like beta-hydroxyacid dehydrogenase n=1 Tax=Homoserinimonas aerilata TaxID=1162970 RepID=A0A542YAG6_9MICO|nr:DUF1932 domain-containing protein [Homoserinimonas aerilata]TQL45033.1 3-hydroxyisobutyrate dehydrogenase-like beta-hydroxyacid dehydrogenase [Homoserinimonas aerilata]
MRTITVLGFGEAGRLYAADLAAAGARVKGYDPFARFEHEGVTQFDDIAAALDGADLAISLVGARASEAVAMQALPHLGNGAIFADLNTASPASKAAIAASAADTGVLFADVAVLAPVPRAGARTPLMASGTGADALRDMLMPFGVPVESIGGVAGDAAGRKLLRSVFMKGLAGVVIETAEAGRRAGSEEWVRGQMADELGPDGAGLVERLITGSHAHSGRRRHEIQDALDYVRDLGLEGWMSAGALEWLSSIDDAKQAAASDAVQN